MVTQVRFEGRRGKTQLLIGARPPRPGHSRPADERIPGLGKLATGSKQDALDALWLTTRLNAGIPTGVAARTNGANGPHPPLLLWYDSAQQGQRRCYKGVGNTRQPEFTSEKPQARVLDDLDHAFSVMALCKRAGYSHVTLRRPGVS